MVNCPLFWDAVYRTVHRHLTLQAPRKLGWLESFCSSVRKRGLHAHSLFVVECLGCSIAHCKVVGRARAATCARGWVDVASNSLELNILPRPKLLDRPWYCKVGPKSVAQENI